MSTPWMPLYVRDYLADTGHLSTLEHGVYLLLIMHYWQRGGLPKEDSKLAHLVHLRLQDWNLVRCEISKFFDAEWRHKRIDAELKKASEIRHKRSEAGKKGGRPAGQKRKSKSLSFALANEKQLHTQPQPQPHCSTDTLVTEAAHEEGREGSKEIFGDCRVPYSEADRAVLAFEFDGVDIDAAIAELERWCDRRGIRDVIDRKNAIHGALRIRHAKAKLAGTMNSAPASVSPQLAASRLVRKGR